MDDVDRRRPRATSASYASAPAPTIEWIARGAASSSRIRRAMPSFESSDSTGDDPVVAEEHVDRRPLDRLPAQRRVAAVRELTTRKCDRRRREFGDQSGEGAGNVVDDANLPGKLHVCHSSRRMDRTTVNVYEAKRRRVDRAAAPGAAAVDRRVRARGSRPACARTSAAGRAGTAAISARPWSRSTPRSRWRRRSARSHPTRGRSSPTSNTCRSGRGALTGAWAHKSYMHIAAERLPMALADLHRVDRGRRRAARAGDVRPAARERRTTTSPAGTSHGGPPDRLRDVVEGAGFTIERIRRRRRGMDRHRGDAGRDARRHGRARHARAARRTEPGSAARPKSA